MLADCVMRRYAYADIPLMSTGKLCRGLDRRESALSAEGAERTLTLMDTWPAPSSNRQARFFKVVVTFESRPDGGLRAFSNDVPGFVLSHKNVDLLLADIAPALSTILSAPWGGSVHAEPLGNARAMLEDEGVVDPPASMLTTKEYVAHCT